jgi:single-strand DNA-binding protein
MNKVFLSGRLVRDPEVKTTVNGKSLCTFRIATDLNFGENKKTGFYRVSAWGNQGDTISKFCKTGHELFMTARLDYNTWKDKEGKNRSEVSLVLEHFDFGRKPGANREKSLQAEGTPF